MTVVAYQVTPDEEGNRQVAFLDGRVRAISEEEWER